MAQSGVKSIIQKLKKKQISVFDVPEDLENEISIVRLERKLNLRVTKKRGFDIISNSFFVEEELVEPVAESRVKRRELFQSFENFDSYYEFLDGDIYNNSCYSFCPLFDHSISLPGIDLKRINERKSFVENAIDDFLSPLSSEEMESYAKGISIHKHCKKWVQRFNSCDNYDEFIQTITKYRESEISSDINLKFFLFQYIFFNIHDTHRFSIIMKYLSSGGQAQDIIYELCLIYDPDDVIKSFSYFGGSPKTKSKHESDLRRFVFSVKNGDTKYYSKSFFDEKTLYFCEVTYVYLEENEYFPAAKIYRYFETFEDFISCRNGDLRNCDLSKALEFDVDFSNYITDETTKLPIYAYKSTSYSVKKFYRNGKFYVTQQWRNVSGKVVKERHHTFEYFFDFVAFLKGDLSDADLLLCDGLTFLEQWTNIDFRNAQLKSSLCDKFGLQYNPQEVNNAFIQSFECIEQNENETALAPCMSRDLITEEADNASPSSIALKDHECQKLYYISDIHLMHKIQDAKCRSKEDILYVILSVVNTIVSETGNLLLIGGDVASDFDIFRLFVIELSKALPRNTHVVFTLGNHELWSFPNSPIQYVISKYRTLLEDYGMHLLHNDILYCEDHDVLFKPFPRFHLFRYSDLCEMDDTQISNRLMKARFVILGGIGFSGYNREFNANNGIYRDAITRDAEIEDSKKFENLYNRLRPILSKKNAVIFTHMPKKDWCAESCPDSNFVYVSGHTHRNFFHDDGEYRVYSDNQIGYHNKSFHLKYFLIENDYDYFSDYNDGIFKITSKQYMEFSRGKNIPMTFQRSINILYMLKKNGYYCFIHQSENGGLTILDGGRRKKLEFKDVQYYFDNMDAMISMMKTSPALDEFTSLQRQISDTIKKIGGSGSIHGCIIDIDFYNHVYVNPVDKSITGYFATDIINKTVYPSVPALLKKHCPKLSAEYIRLFKGKGSNPFALKKSKNIDSMPQIYPNTDIYRASRELKKIQKLDKNILNFWYEDTLHKKPRIKSK